MTFRIAVLAGLTTLATAGCVDLVDEPDPEVSASAREEIPLPNVVRYARGRVDGARLVPSDVSYIHLTYTPGPERSVYVWGISDGKVLYIYQVATDADDDDLTHQFILTVREREQIGAVKGHSIAGNTRPGNGNPPPPTPVGEPQFSQDYAYAVVTAAKTTQNATLEMNGAISIR